MATGNFYRGTSQTQDARFSNKDKKLLNSREWPPEFDLKVNIKKVELNAIKPWISKRITDILGFEDEVVINLAISELESKDERGPCPKRIQLNLTGFLSNKAGVFMKELWKLLLEAQESPNGIPASLIEERKEEIKQKKEEILSQEAKLESIRAFLKQAGEEIKSKLSHKKGTTHEKEKDDNQDKERRKKDRKIEEVLGEEKDTPLAKEKKHSESRNTKKEDEKDRKSRSKSRSRSHHHKKSKQRKSKDRHKNNRHKRSRSRSHSKDRKNKKNSNDGNSKNNKKAKNDDQKKTTLGSGNQLIWSEDSGHSSSSDESSPISGASSD